MRAKFSWYNFEKIFLEKIIYSPKTPVRFQPQWQVTEKESFIPYMEDICMLPDKTFVKKYRSEIENYFLCGTTQLVNICRTLEKRHYRGIKTGTTEEMFEGLKSKRLTKSLYDLYIKELRAQGRMIDSEKEDSFFTTPKTLDLSTVVASEIVLRDYQDQAVAALAKHFIQNEERAGFLVMPTGSGKTRTAVSFLLKNMVKEGYQIFWLAHRSMLIDQSADSFYTFSGIVKKELPQKETLKMTCVSGEHCNIRFADSSQDVIIASVQSVNRNLDYLTAILGEKVMIVIDEAHHTIAPSYRNIVKRINSLRPGAKLLGLTATPVRLSDQGTINLNKLFDDHIIYEIPLAKLLKTDVLAEPKFEMVNTNYDVEAHINIDEQSYIRKWGELSPDTVDFLARVCERNDLIVDNYCKNKERYGKTLIFAMNAHHCMSLCDALQEKGIRCDYLYTKNRDNTEKIRRFQENKLDVLININMMTEGSDIPDIQTIFLTRPTTSDVLLMQMVGRGLRGKSFGGTKYAYIVDFCDKWTSFTKWLNPKFVFGEEKEVEVILKKDAEIKLLYPWSMFRDIISGISYQYQGSADRICTLPIGWYDVVDKDGNDTNVIVFSEQKEGFEAMAADFEIFSAKTDGIQLQNRYFNHFGLLPAPNDLELLMRQAQIEQKMPQFFEFKQRTEVDVSTVAAKLKEENASITQINETIRKKYLENAEMIQSIYGTEGAFRNRVFDFISNDHGDTSIYSEVEEIPIKLGEYDPTPVYDLEVLQKQIIDECFAGDFPKTPYISWTNYPMRSYFGQYIADYDRILINKLLNSKNIPVEVVKFVIYHEMLHQEEMRHNREFRAKEHLYPNFVYCEYFLYETFNQFDFETAM